MGLSELLNSRRAGMLALSICRLLPPAGGHRLANALARWLASHRELPMVQAIRQNQWVVNGEQLTADELDQAVEEVIYHIARSFYVLFHYHNRPKAVQRLIDYSPIIEELIARSQEGKQGAVAVGLHMSNFDLLMQAVVQHGLRAMAIALPQTTEAHEWQNRMRRNVGVELVTASMASVRKAIRHLQTGGVVITGMDHPVPGTHVFPHFFGRPADLPVHYINLALAAKVPLIVASASKNSDGLYRFIASDFLTMKPGSNRRDEILYNAEMALEVAEGMIRNAPRQWLIFQPVWPEVAQLVPQSQRN